MSDWRPFGLEDDEVEEFATLTPGVPEWLKEPLVAWMARRLTASSSGGWFSRDAILKLQNETRVSLGVIADTSPLVDSRATRRAIRALPDSKFLRLTDYLVSISSYRLNGESAVALGTILDAGGSAFRVGMRFGKVGLVDRVPEGVRVAVESTIAKSGTAGRLLARAWDHVHGVVKSDSAGYTDAVRAVEAAAIPVVLGPKPDPEATLGTVIRRMREDADWKLPLREHDFAPSAEMLIQLLRTLWRGHSDRHGSPDYRDVTHEEARAGVILAATLIDWFTSGVVARRP